VAGLSSPRRTPLEPSDLPPTRAAGTAASGSRFLCPPPLLRARAPRLPPLHSPACSIPRSLCFPFLPSNKNKSPTPRNHRCRLRQPTSSRRRRPCPGPSPRAPTFATCAATCARSTRRFARSQCHIVWYMRFERPAATPPRPPRRMAATWDLKTSRSGRHGGRITTCSRPLVALSIVLVVSAVLRRRDSTWRQRGDAAGGVGAAPSAAAAAATLFPTPPPFPHSPS
jgi:hypothetical protein